MLIGYMRVSKADGSQATHLQRDALISEQTQAGLASARVRGRIRGRPYKMTHAKLRLAMAAMGKPEIKVGDLSEELVVFRQTLYRQISALG